jgi:hypothetical protein
VRFYEASSRINATPAAVWAVLADGARWAEWDSGVDAVEGRIALHEKIKVRSAAAPGKAFPVTVTAFDAPQLLRFSGGMPLGLFRGVRTYDLTAVDGGTTVFRMREEYTGPMVSLIWRSMPELGPSFTRFADGLKQRVESGS